MKINSEDCYGVKQINMTTDYFEEVKRMNPTDDDNSDKEGWMPCYRGVPINIDDDMETDYELVR